MIGGLLCVSVLLGCRVDNPAFDLLGPSSHARDDTTQEDKVSTSDKEEPTLSAQEPSTSSDAASDSSMSTDEGSSASQTSSSESSTDSEVSETSTQEVEVQDVCNKGAELCFEMQVVEDDFLDNSAPVNREIGLNMTAVASGATEDSPVFGHRLRLGTTSSLKSSQDIAIPAGSSFGVDVWFTPDFSGTSSMVLVRIGEVMSIEIHKSGLAKCHINAKNTTTQVQQVAKVESTYFGNLAWRVVSCRLHQGSIQFWNSDAPFAAPSVRLELPQKTNVRLMLGQVATKNLDGDFHGGFVGDLHLMRFWLKAENYAELLKAELKFSGLNPAN